MQIFRMKKSLNPFLFIFLPMHVDASKTLPWRYSKPTLTEHCFYENKISDFRAMKVVYKGKTLLQPAQIPCCYLYFNRLFQKITRKLPQYQRRTYHRKNKKLMKITKLLVYLVSALMLPSPYLLTLRPDGLKWSSGAKERSHCLVKLFARYRIYL